VRARIVYARDALELPGVLARAQEAARFHEEARVATDVPTRMVLVDRRAALVPLAPVASSGSLLIRSSLLVEALWALFESVWEHAVPQGAESDELDEHDRTIVALMAAGLKDEAIARRLGVAERTVGRRISALLAELGASTRFQAGIQAARRGWLP
jgi:DNA-binding CsgD family transcriptional regulator